jgi:hypothetical protein
VLRGLCSFLLLLVLFGCAPVGLTSKERAAINSGDRAFVLVRVDCTVDERPLEPCLSLPSLSARRFVSFALGDFDTFGEPRHIDVRALSEGSFGAGWAFLLLSPGYHYLYVLGLDTNAGYQPAHFRDAPRWQIEVPEQTKWIYAGTLILAGKDDGALMFGDKIIKPVKDQKVPLSDERESAGKLVAKHVPDAGEVRTILMKRRHPGEPFIFRSSWPDSKKQL